MPWLLEAEILARLRSAVVLPELGLPTKRIESVDMMTVAGSILEMTFGTVRPAPNANRDSCDKLAVNRRACTEAE